MFCGSKLLSREGNALLDPDLNQNYRPVEAQTKNFLFWLFANSIIQKVEIKKYIIKKSFS